MNPLAGLFGSLFAALGWCIGRAIGERLAAEAEPLAVDGKVVDQVDDPPPPPPPSPATAGGDPVPAKGGAA